MSYRGTDGTLRDLATFTEAERRLLLRTQWGFVRQNPEQGLRMAVSAGGNVGERLMAVGWRHYGDIREEEATGWLGRVEIAADRIDDDPRSFSGGMRQRLQIAATSSPGRASSSWTSRPAVSTSPCRRACWTSSARW